MELAEFTFRRRAIGVLQQRLLPTAADAYELDAALRQWTEANESGARVNFRTDNLKLIDFGKLHDVAVPHIEQEPGK